MSELPAKFGKLASVRKKEAVFQMIELLIKLILLKEKELAVAQID